MSKRSGGFWASSSVFSGFFTLLWVSPGGAEIGKKHCLNFVKQKRPKTNDFRGSNPVSGTSPFLGLSAVLAVGLFLAFFHCLSVLGTSWPHRLNFLAFFGFSGSPRAGPKLVKKMA